MLKRLNSLNALRGFAALLVALDHVILITTHVTEGALFYFATFIGAFGVGAFFLLSGFVICLSLDKISVKEFLLHRVFRLYPVIVCAVSLRLVLQLVTGVRDFNLETVKIFLLNISLFGNAFIPIDKNIEPIIWTLTIEIKFYILIALIYVLFGKLVNKFAFPIYLTVGFIFATLGFVYPSIITPLEFDLALGVSAIPFMLLGTVTYYFYANVINFKKFIQLNFVFLFAFSFAPLKYFLFFEKGLLSWILAYIIFMACIFSKSLEKYSSHSWWFLLAAISYPVYAIHTTVVELVMSTSPGTEVNSLVLRSLVLIPVFAFFIHKFVELPTHKWSKTILKDC